MGWLEDILWGVWAAASTLSSVAFLLLAGLVLFGVFVWAPYAVRRSRREGREDQVLRHVPESTRERIRQLAHLDDAGAILAADPELGALLSGFGPRPVDLVERVLATLPAEVEEEEEAS